MNVREIFMRQRQAALKDNTGAGAGPRPEHAPAEAVQNGIAAEDAPSECADTRLTPGGKGNSATSATSATYLSLRVAKSVGHIALQKVGKQVAEVAEVASCPAIQPVVPQDLHRPTAHPECLDPPPLVSSMFPTPPACPIPGEPLIINPKEVFLP